MKKYLLPSILIIAAISIYAGTRYINHPLAGSGTIEVSNLQHELVTTMVVRFSRERAPSCLPGDWQQVEIISLDTIDESFFPTTQPLAYQLNNNQLTIGRSHICDAYLFLDGTLINTQAAGNYNELGITIGVEQLGYFTLSKGEQ